MNLPFQFWRKYTTCGAIIAIPAVLLVFIEPNLNPSIHWLLPASEIFIFVLGASGALLVILRKAGFIRFTYSEADRNSFHYKMLKLSEKNENGA